MSPARVLLVVANPHVRTAIEHLLASLDDVAGVVADEDAAQAWSRLDHGHVDADVILVDLGRDPRAGLEFSRRAATKAPLIVLGTDDTYRDAALAMGATAFVPMNAGPDELLRALRSAASRRVRDGRTRLLAISAAVFAGPWLIWGSRIAEANEALSWHVPTGLALWSMTPSLLLAVALTAGRDGLRDLARRLLRWRVPAWTYAVALGAPALLGSIALLGVTGTGHRAGVGVDLSLPAALAFLPFGTVLYLLTEEAAWRGVLLPRLQRRLSAGSAALGVGLMWAVWHLPLLSTPGEKDQGLPFAGFAVLVVATSVMVTALVNAAGGSVLVAAVYHASFDACYAFFGVVGSDHSMFWSTTAVSVLVAAGLLILTRGRLARQSDPSVDATARMLPAGTT